MKRLLPSPLFFTLLLTGCGLGDLDRRNYEIEQELIEKSIEIYRESADKDKEKALQFKSRGSQYGALTFGNQSMKYNLEILKLVRYGECLEGKLYQKLKFRKAKTMCVTETGTDPSKPSLFN